jgi:cell division protein FtsL
MFLSQPNFGNLARTQQAQPRPAPQQKKKVTVHYGIPVEEKLLYLFGVLLFVCAMAFTIYRYSLISQYNHQIEQTKHEISTMQEENSTLILQRDELSRRERILSIAQKEMGMTIKDSTVRILSR